MLVPSLILLSSCLSPGEPTPAASGNASGNDGRAATPRAVGESAAALRPEADGGWDFSMTPYLWLLGIGGDVRVRNSSAHVDVGFDELWDDLSIALMGRVEAWNGRLGLYLDPVYSQLESEAESGGADVTLETEMLVVDFGVMYRVLESTSADERSCRGDLSLGGRYSYLKSELDFDVLADHEQSTDFVDLTVGGRYAMDLTDRLGFLVMGDVGGFDIGSSSDFAWNLEGLGSFEIGESGRVWAGYRLLDYDRDDGGASGIELQFSGPVVGYEFRL
jgi:hypothetical protein